MIETNEKVSSVIKELIVINNDRYEGYQTASEETKDADLKALFSRYSLQSKQFNYDLRRLMPDAEAPDQDTTKASGKLYRVWMDLKAAVASNDRKAVLSSCEFGEDVALSTYKEALEDNELSEEVKILVRKQKSELLEAHNTIKAIRDRA